jgi:hypothetical protein
MCEAGGLSDRFWISAGKMRLYTDRGPLIVRLRAREEADARFEINDAVGCHFSVDPMLFYVTNTLVRTQAEVRLSIVRDSIDQPAYRSDTKGIVARMLVDQDSGGSNTLHLSLHAKGGGTNTYGVQIASYGPLGFVPGGTMALWVTATDAVLSYNGTDYCSGAHTNLDLSSWPNGAVCALEVAEAVTGTTWFVELDNLKAWKDDVPAAPDYSETFTNYAGGIALLAKPQRLAIRDWSPNDDWDNSIATNGNVKWIPEYRTEGWTYLNPRTEYQNALRLQLSETNAVDVQANLTDFSKGTCKLAFLPEYFPGNMLNNYAGPTLYVSATYTNGSLRFDLVRQWGVDTNHCEVVSSATNAYVPGQTISFQMGPTRRESTTARMF